MTISCGIWSSPDWGPTFLSQLKEQLIHLVILDVDVPVFAHQAEGLLFDREVAEFEQVVCRDVPRDHDGEGTVLVADGFLERGQDTPLLSCSEAMSPLSLGSSTARALRLAQW